MAAKITVKTKGEVDVYDLKIGDIVVGAYDNQEYIVCGETYDDGIDDMVVCKDNNGEIHHLSPLLLM